MRFGLMAACAMAICVPSGTAQDKKGQEKETPLWAESWEEAVKEATIRNVCILYHIHGDGAQKIQEMVDDVRKGSYVQASKAFVNVIVNQNNGHGEETVTVDGQEVRRCKRYGGIPCDSHVKMWESISKTGAVQGDNAQIMIPQVWILGPGGSLIEAKNSNGGNVIPSSDVLKDAMQIMQKLGGEHMSYDKWLQMSAARGEWKRAWEKGDWKKAMAAALTLKKSSSKILRIEGEQGLNKMSDKGDELLSQAHSLLSSNPEEGKKLYKKIAEEFKPLSASRKAAEALAAIK